LSAHALSDQVFLALGHSPLPIFSCSVI
jgi:hypothetical protein